MLQAGTAGDELFAPDRGRVPDFTRGQGLDRLPALVPTAAQTQAWTDFQSAHPGAVLRWDDAAGSIDVLYGFAGPAGGASAEDAARAFLAQHADLLGGLQLGDLELDTAKTRAALGGTLVRFNQTYEGLPVETAGFGLVLDGDHRVRAVFGPFYDGISLNTTPSLSAAQALVTAQLDLAPYALNLGVEALSVLTPTFDLMAQQLGPFAVPDPRLVVFPDGAGMRLGWSFYYFSHNPFGVFRYVVDAQNGSVLHREDFVRRVAEDEPVQTDMYADYFPTFPTITDALKDFGALLDADGGETGTPLGQLRIRLRKFDETNRVTGQQGVLTGDHALILNALPTKAPFAQAAAGTWYFSQDALPLEGRTDERDHLAEPAEHQDGISQFIYITNLIEYLDYLHRSGDAVHNPGLGQGDFPDSYPNDETPLVGVVHIPNATDPPQDPTHPDFLAQLLGLDNAFAVPLTQNIAGEEVVINPTFYGHGYLFNNLAVDFSVPMHEGTHATITPIAGFEGSPEGGALNEGQADLWAYTIGETPDLGAYPVAGSGLRQYLRDNNVDPDSFQYIRSAQSQIRYSQLGTRDNAFEVHRDGEIYAGAMWDLREFMLAYETGGGFTRPDPITGEATVAVSLGKETWERLFLGSMYILGVSTPDTFVRARDAVIIADQILYPSDPLDLQAPGRHRALIERVFAARELGLYAKAPVGGRQTVSTAVSAFTALVAAPAAPQNVTAEPVDPETLFVTWDPVPGALGYQVLKRKNCPGFEHARLFPGVPDREYLEGDASFTGFTHVEFVIGGDVHYTDHGQGYGRGPGQGLDHLDYAYVVRAIGLDGDGQVGFSALSGVAGPAKRLRDVGDAVDTAVSDVAFDGRVFSFNQTLTNIGGAGDLPQAPHGDTLLAPLTFKVISISDPTVTLLNADNGGSGQNGDEGHFVYDTSLAVGETSAPRLLQFDDPRARLFTFDALVTAYVRTTPVPATGSGDPGDQPEPNEEETLYHAYADYTGLVPIGLLGGNTLPGVDYVDVTFNAAPSAVGIVATLSAENDIGGVLPDLDFELRDSTGNVLAASGNLGPNEEVAGALIGGATYTLRVLGYTNALTTFHIHADQFVTDPADAGGEPSATSGSGVLLFRFTVNPLLGTIIPHAL